MLRVNKRHEIHWKPIKEERNLLLDITDKYAVVDRLNPEQMQELIAYRQALRDLPSQTEVTTRIVWPTPPSFIKELNND